MKQPLRISVTGAAGRMAYSFLFKIASGELFGEDQPIYLQLIEVENRIEALEGVCMELIDCAYPLLQGISVHYDLKEGFDSADYAFLIGAKPRTKGMERADLLEQNAQIFSAQGKAINNYASRNIKVVVIGNPANTNAFIAASNAPDLNPSQFTSLTRLDHNRAVGILGSTYGINALDIYQVAIWGNHSATQFPSLEHAYIGDEEVLSLVKNDWYKNNFIPQVAKRGGSVIEKAGLSSAASPAQAIIDHTRDWIFGSDDWVSMGIISDGSYGIAKGIYYSFPIICQNGKYQIVHDLDLTDFAKTMLKKNEIELLDEKKAINSNLIGSEKHLLNLPKHQFHNETDFAVNPLKGKVLLRNDRIL